MGKLMNLSKILVDCYGMDEKASKMSAGKSIKKVTGEKAPEDGLVELDVILETFQATIDSKASKFKEIAKEAKARFEKGDFEDSWFEPNVKKEAGTAVSPKASKDAEKLKRIQRIAEEDGLLDILEIINE